MEILIIALILIAYILIAYFLNKLAKDDISNMFRWAKYLYSVLIPINISMWFYESMITGDWLDVRNNTTLPFFISLIISAILIMGWFVFLRIRNRKSRGTLKYGVTYYDKNIEFSNYYGYSRLWILLNMSMILYPVLNIIFIFRFIKIYFL